MVWVELAMHTAYGPPQAGGEHRETQPPSTVRSTVRSPMRSPMRSTTASTPRVEPQQPSGNDGMPLRQFSHAISVTSSSTSSSLSSSTAATPRCSADAPRANGSQGNTPPNVPLWQKRSLGSMQVHLSTSAHALYAPAEVASDTSDARPCHSMGSLSARVGHRNRHERPRYPAPHSAAPPERRGVPHSPTGTASPASSRASSASPPRPPHGGSASATPRTPATNELYKTELCRSWTETGTCRYGLKCQFAHGEHELRQLRRHPKYKTKVCKNYAEHGSCPYGSRCRFIHERDRSRSFEGLDPELLAAVTAGGVGGGGGGGALRKLPIFEQIHQGLVADDEDEQQRFTAETMARDSSNTLGRFGLAASWDSMGIATNAAAAEKAPADIVGYPGGGNRADFTLGRPRIVAPPHATHFSPVTPAHAQHAPHSLTPWSAREQRGTPTSTGAAAAASPTTPAPPARRTALFGAL